MGTEEESQTQEAAERSENETSVTAQEESDGSGEQAFEASFTLGETSSVEVSGALISCRGERIADTSNWKVCTVDFRNPILLTRLDMRRLCQRYQAFSDALSPRFSMFLRSDVRTRLVSVKTQLYQDFTQAIPDPSHVALFRLEGLRGVGHRQISVALARGLVDRMLGGHSEPEENDTRSLTEIEATLVQDAIQLALNEWCSQWEDVMPLCASMMGSENSGQFLQTSVKDALMMVASLELKLGGQKHPIQIALPYLTVDPLVEVMRNREKSTQEEVPEKRSKWVPGYEDILIPVSAEWDAFSFTVGDYLTLRAGDILELPKSVLSETQLRLSGRKRFLGEVGIVDDRVAIKITETVEEGPSYE
ncbi:MAG TPA: flagellar motor switch protein FliM [Opitutae bacterium]|nr:flagellar motor switch protein FliM [Opitutae bacterium]